MAGRGKPRTPNEILRLRGSYKVSRKTGKRYDGTGIDAPPGSHDPPPSLKGEALAAWQDLVKGLTDLGLFANTDRRVLARYCRLWARWTKDCDKPDAAIDTMLRISASLRQLEGELGLSPAARQRLRSDTKPVGNDAAAKKAKEYFGGSA